MMDSCGVRMLKKSEKDSAVSTLTLSRNLPMGTVCILSAPGLCDSLHLIWSRIYKADVYISVTKCYGISVIPKCHV